ncbi:MAG: 2-amino-4-hydroxy-6-hydroxymethyldihydropteridine diphosphokinase [Bacteroidota bacterium]|nr:2-amino-4-hydroxy-6-hydroxymethyldihydropteridine diphosphokinase [Bacteroidota bacterium]
MHSVFLLLGSNKGDRVELLNKAITQIGSSVGEIAELSSVYETEPWGFDDETPFLNQVIKINTTLEPYDVLSKILQIELVLGRVRKSKNYEPRVIDIDILFFDEMVINDSPDLIIPHPRLHQRKFTLMPLKEINSQMVHPVKGKTISELMDDCDDNLKVEKFVPVTLIS